MRIEQVLNESLNDPLDQLASEREPVEYTAPSIDVSLEDLTSLQVRTLNRISNGLVTVDTASDKEFEIMQELEGLGLLDSEYEISELGTNVLSGAKDAGVTSTQSSVSDAMVDVDLEDDELPEDDDEFEELDQDEPASRW
jgi:hypothetical protein